MRIVLKLVMILALLGGLGLVGYAYLGDLAPARAPVVQPVSVDAD